MKRKFRIELAKIFSIIAGSLVGVIGLFFNIPIETLLLRILIAGIIFLITGYLLGIYMDKEQEKLEIKSEKEKIKAQLRHNYQNIVEKDQNVESDFEPLDVEKITKIVVDSLEK